MSSLIEKSFLSDKLATKTFWKLGVVAVFIIFGIFWAFFVSAGWTDDFETYELGSDLNGQGGWTSPVGNILIQNTKVKTGEQGIYTFVHSGNYAWRYTLDTAMGLGKMKVWVLSVFGTGYTDRLEIYLMGAESKCIARLRFHESQAVEYFVLGSTYQIGTYASNTWYSVEIEWNSPDKLVRYNFNDEGWTDWVSTTSITDFEVEKLNFSFNRWLDRNKWYLDKMSISGVCSIGDCGACVDFYSCQEVGCCHYYDYLLQDMFCMDCDVGECDDSMFGCQHCLTQETCELNESCYWFNNLCKFKIVECGGGLACQFCDTQETCEAKDCYWYSNFCWITEPLGVSSWADYYTEHGGYDISLAFIDEMAGLTENIFNSVGGFLAVFAGAFDTSEAMTRGANFGSAIPKARGYLAIFNNFFGELPVAQMFLFLITFLLAVGVFRLIRNLIALAKFW